ncbi:MAG: hypothetical protein WBW85_10870 [Terriglobales bacterium]
MKCTFALSFVVFSLLTFAALGQTTTSMGGYCDTVSTFNAPFVLDGLGQSSTHGCTYLAFSPGATHPSALLGTLVRQNGTLENLYVKQFELNSAAMGGTVSIWVSPKTGGAAVQTPITCTPSFYTSAFYTCHNTSSTYSVVAGDRVMAVATPPSEQYMSPLTATIDLATTATTTTPTLGWCGSNSYASAFILFGMGQTSDSDCVWGPGTPVQPYFGQVLTKTGTLKNLYVKQEQIPAQPYAFGGTVNVWVNPKTGTSPIETSISCSLPTSGYQLVTCSNTTSTYSVQSGDQIIVIVTPSTGVSPIAATIDEQ